MNRLFFFGPLLAALALISAGCGSVGYQGTKTAGPTLQSTESLIYLDSALKSAIPCEAISATQLPSGRIRVTARFVNKQDHTAECQVKLRFKDGTGRIIDETNWMPFLLPRREVTQFEHTSLAVASKDFTLLLRKATE